MSQSALIQANKVRMEFGEAEQRIIALNDVSVSLFAGALTILRGPSGSGKSSLLSALGGLQKPSGGVIKAMGEDIWSLPETKLTAFRRRHCGYVFQSVGLFPALCALDQLVVPLRYLGFDVQSATYQAEQALAEVGLAERAHSLPSEMSGGQNQRVAIARMLSKDPAMIFCDEPTSALDTRNGARVAELLRNAAKARNAMVFCVTHDDRLSPFADRILDIEDGRILRDRPNTAPGAGGTDDAQTV